MRLDYAFVSMVCYKEVVRLEDDHILLSCFLLHPHSPFLFFIFMF